MSDRNTRLVYATGTGRTCPACGWPADDCHCASAVGGDTPLPGVIVATLRIEKKGRGGKTVTIVDSLPTNASFLNDLARDLKKACATGGAVRDGRIELQGDHRELLRKVLAARRFRVKG